MPVSATNSTFRIALRPAAALASSPNTGSANFLPSTLAATGSSVMTADTNRWRPRADSTIGLNHEPGLFESVRHDSHLSGLAPKCLLPDYIGDQENSILQMLTRAEWISPDVWPLVFHGPPGVGKTTLALLIWQQILEWYRLQAEKVPNTAGRTKSAKPMPPPYAIQLSAVDFSKTITSAVETDSVQQCWDHFLAAKVVLIDNLQQLSSQPSAQTQLVKLIDLLMDKQIPTICTLDRHPLNHSQLHDNLISRLCQGLVLPLNTPGKLARAMIITELAHSLNVELTTTQRNNLLDSEHMSVPLLYQRILQIKLKKKTGQATATAPSAVSRNPASSRGVQFSRNTVTSRDSTAPGDQINATVCQVVAADFELSTRELCGNSRKQTTVLARGVAIYLLRSLYQLSFTAIGRVFAGRDHSTTIHAYQKINDRLSTDHALNQRIQRLSAKLQTMLPLLLTDEESPC